MKIIELTKRAESIKASGAAEVYGTTVEIIKALKHGQQVEVSDEVADKMIAAGHAQEVS